MRYTGPRFFIGIDPGKHGAIGIVDSDGELVHVEDQPLIIRKNTKVREIDIKSTVGVMRQFEKYFGGRAFCLLERQAGIPRKGKLQTVCSICHSFGIWEGLLTSIGLEYRVVDPKLWQKYMLVGITGEDTKRRALDRCTRQWPSERHKFFGPKGGHRDGRTDALLIAEYCRLILGEDLVYPLNMKPRGRA